MNGFASPEFLTMKTLPQKQKSEHRRTPYRLPDSTLLPADCRRMLQDAAKVDEKRRSIAIDKAIRHIRLHSPQFFTQEQEQ